MDAVVTALVAAITPATLWGVVTDAIPYIAVVVVFALGYGIFRKLVKGTAKGKVRF